MNKYSLLIGFIIGFFTAIIIILKELIGKISLNRLKQLWEILND